MSAPSPYYSSQVSADLIWEVARSQNSYLVQRNSGGGVQFSRDPLNLTNVHSRKQAGFVNEKAVGVASGPKGAITLTTKKQKKVQQPGQQFQSVTFSGAKSARKTYKAIATSTAQSGYRADLRAPAIARASALRSAQRPKKTTPESKLRGAKARKAEEAKEE